MTILGIDGEIPIAPSKVVERLQELHPDLGLKFIPAYLCWAVTWRWPQEDSRREKLLTGEVNINDAYDIFMFLPEDVSPEEVVPYVEQKCVRNSGKAEVTELLNRLDEYNQKQQRINFEPVSDLAQELVETNAPTLFKDKHIPKSTKIGPRSNKDEKQFQEFLHDR